MKILVINGPNINMLGIREPKIYGNGTYEDLCRFIESAFEEYKVTGEIFQSNHEGDIVGRIQQAYGDVDGIVINAAAYTHTSIATMDALLAVGIPSVEVHISDTDTREEFRKKSFVSLAAERMIKGKGFEGYREAIAYLASKGEDR